MLNKLNIGCGMYQIIDHWINIDYIPNYKLQKFKYIIKNFLRFFSLYQNENWEYQKQYFQKVVQLDITRELPYNSNSVDYIYTSHLLEHLTLEQGISFLSECQRVLKPNHTIRIVVPDLDFFISLYRNNTQEHLKALRTQYPEFQNCREPIDALNKIFHVAGHHYIYNLKKLQTIALKIGFNEITRKEHHDSREPGINQIELLRIENLIVELKK